MVEPRETVTTFLIIDPGQSFVSLWFHISLSVTRIMTNFLMRPYSIYSHQTVYCYITLKSSMNIPYFCQRYSGHRVHNTLLHKNSTFANVFVSFSLTASCSITQDMNTHVWCENMKTCWEVLTCSGCTVSERGLEFRFLNVTQAASLKMYTTYER